MTAWSSHNQAVILVRMLQDCPGTRVVASDDVELLRSCVDTLWCIEEASIAVFSGAYDALLHERRTHLSAFLFCKNVDCLTQTLSGGEKARLCLALIAANPPKLLVLDELTNNLDLETREHLLHVLRAYPGALLLVDHDADFLKYF